MSASNRLDSLDTLRGVAILSVIAFHAGGPVEKSNLLTSVLGLGNLGVQLFFLISALTMCHMWGQRQGEDRASLKFYIRRSFRIAPPFWFALVFYTAIRYLQNGSFGEVSATDIVLTLLFLHGFSVHAINLVVPGGWSIAVEMSFYALFPHIVARWQSVRQRLLLGLGCYMAGVAATVALTPHLPGDASGFLYYSLLTQLPIFPLGMALHTALQDPAKVPWRTVAGVGVLWGAIALTGKLMGLPTRPFFWLPVFVIMAGMWVVIRRDLKLAPLVWAGRWSYSLYLFHFAAIDLALRPIAPHLPAGLPGYVLALTLTLGLSLAVAWIASRTLEAWSSDWGRSCIRWLDSRSPRQAR